MWTFFFSSCVFNFQMCEVTFWEPCICQTLYISYLSCSVFVRTSLGSWRLRDLQENDDPKEPWAAVASPRDLTAPLWACTSELRCRQRFTSKRERSLGTGAKVGYATIACHVFTWGYVLSRVFTAMLVWITSIFTYFFLNTCMESTCLLLTKHYQIYLRFDDKIFLKIPPSRNQIANHI